MTGKALLNLDKLCFWSLITTNFYETKQFDRICPICGRKIGHTKALNNQTVPINNY